MERIFSGEVYDMLPQPGGLIFSYCRSSLDGKVAVFYKMYSLEQGTVDDMTHAVYLISKFGSNYHSAASFSKNHITAKAAVFPNGKVFVCSDEGNAMLLDGGDSIIWSGEFKYRDAVPSDIAIYKNSLWASFAEKNALIRFNLLTMREELRIGGKGNTPFDHPYDIFIDGDTAVISNKNSQKLVRVNLQNYTAEDMLEFSEAVYGYAKVKDTEFVLLESGIYKL